MLGATPRVDADRARIRGRAGRVVRTTGDQRVVGPRREVRGAVLRDPSGTFVPDPPGIDVRAAAPVRRSCGEREPPAVNRERRRLADDLDAAGDRELLRGGRRGRRTRVDRCHRRY